MSRQRRKKGRPISGWVVLDKPVGVGSTECVSRIKRLYDAAKAGHAGTLDPLASGMLPIALGEATRTVSYIMDGRKSYRFTVAWGAQTGTDDLEGEVVAESALRPDRDAVEAAARAFTGEIDQIPPAYSAVKIDGQRAYKLAREGCPVEIEPRKVTVHRLELVAAPDGDHAVFECECGKGTYVRAIARDIGRMLGCLGHVSELRRIGVGPFDEADMVELDTLLALDGDRERLDCELLSTGTALDGIAEIAIGPGEAGRIRAGNSVILRGRDAVTYAEEAFAVLGHELVAIGAVDRGCFQPKRVFRHSQA